MKQTVSKSQLKPHLLKYLRKVEEEKKDIVVTHWGKPVVKITPYTEKNDNPLKILRGTVIEYKDPTEPVGKDYWEALK